MVHDAAEEPDLPRGAAETTPDQLDTQLPWALAWQLRHPEVLERALA